MSDQRPGGSVHANAGRWLLGVGVLAVCFALAMRYAGDQQLAVPQVSRADWPQVLCLVLALFAVNLVNGLVLRDLVAHFGVRLRLRAWLSLTLVGSLVNLVSPVRGGAALRAVYLKRVYGVALGEVATVLVGSTVCSLAVTAALGAATIAVLGVPGGAYGWTVLLASAVLAALLAASLRIGLPPGSALSRVPRIRRASEAWRSIGRQPALLRRLLAWNILTASLHALAFYLAFSLAGFADDWRVPVTSSAFARMGTIIALTPAGLGVFEAFGVLSASLAGANAAGALAGVLIVRVVGAAVTIVAGLCTLPLLMRETVATDAAQPATGEP